MARGPREVVLEESRSSVIIDGRMITLTRTQFSIVAYLIRHSERWVTAAELIQEVLGTHHEPDTALIRVHVHNIRRRLGDDARCLMADRRCWRGYRWCTTGDTPAPTTRSGLHSIKLPRSR